MDDNKITLRQLLNYLCCGEEVLQVVKDNWDTFDVVYADSDLLKPFYDYKIKEMEIIERDTVRVSLIKGE